MALNAFVSNQGTQTNLLTDSTGGTSGTLIPVMKIDISPYGTAGTAWGGAVTVTSGSINGTVNIGNTPSIGTIGTLGLGSVVVNTLPNLPQGSIQITAGTIASVGTIGTLGLGTITGNLGTIGTLGLGTITGNLGTIGTLGLGSVVVNTLPNLPQGSIQVTAGTIATLGTMGTLGTIQNLGSVTNVGQVYNAGTLQAGTLNVGTLSPIPSIAISTYGTHGTTGASVFGTLAGGTGAGAGTEIFITSLSLTIPSTGGSQDVSIGWGSNGGTFQAGTGLLVRGNFPAGGGIQKQFYPPVNSGTNGQLMYFQAGAGTVDISVSYFITPSTL